MQNNITRRTDAEEVRRRRLARQREAGKLKKKNERNLTKAQEEGGRGVPEIVDAGCHPPSFKKH